MKGCYETVRVQVFLRLFFAPYDGDLSLFPQFTIAVVDTRCRRIFKSQLQRVSNEIENGWLSFRLIRTYIWGPFKIDEHFSRWRTSVGHYLHDTDNITMLHEHEFSTAATPLLYSGARRRPREEIHLELWNFCSLTFSVMPLCAMPFKRKTFRVMPFCLISFHRDVCLRNDYL